MLTLPNIDISKPVQVYRNLNKPGVQFSVRQGGKVRCYVDSIALGNATFKHATPKQLEAVRTGARQVCQWITGIVIEGITIPAAFSVGRKKPLMSVRVSCDPKTSDGFTVDGVRIDSAVCATVSSKGCFAAIEFTN